MTSVTPHEELPQAVARVAASAVGVVARRHASSGVVWRDGIVVGNASSLWRSSTVALVLPDGEEVKGEVRGVDGGTDLAAVTFEGNSPPPVARVADVQAEVGSFVFAVGRDPSGLTQASFGHVGKVGREWRTWRGGRVDSLVRLDGGLYPGLAGAVVADTQGRAWGVGSGAFSRHHGVVLPVSTIDRVLDALLTHGRVVRGYLGIAAQPASTSLDGKATEGLLVSSIADDGPAARGGLQVGDVIVTLEGTAVDALDDLRDRLQVGRTVSVSVIRGGEAKTLALDVAERPRGRCG